MAKVISYKDIEVARSKRAVRDAAKDSAVAKGKPGRKHKGTMSALPEVEKARKSEVEIVEDEIVAGGIEDYCSILQF